MNKKLMLTSMESKILLDNINNRNQAEICGKFKYEKLE